MRWLLSVLVVVFAAISAWLWLSNRSGLGLQTPLKENTGAEIASDGSSTGGKSFAPPSQVDAEAGPAQAGTEERTDYDAWERRLLQNATYREARRRFRLLELTEGHVDLAKELGISDADAKRLIALLVDNELKYASEPHPDPNSEVERETRMASIQEAQRLEDEEIASIIGESRLKLWKDYQDSLPIRHWVNQLGATLFAEGAPLSAEQADTLIDVIHQERSSSRQELKDFNAGLPWSGGTEAKSHAFSEQRSMELTVTRDRRILDAAGRFLSSAQLQVLDDMLQRQREIQGAEFEMFRAQDEAARAFDITD